MVLKKIIAGAYLVAMGNIPLIQATGARTYMHAADVPMVESGGPFRPMKPAPGLVRNVMLHLVFN